jgi:ABC-type amino acid transport substrate-binding protein
MYKFKPTLLHLLAGAAIVLGSAACSQKAALTEKMKSEEDLSGHTLSTSAGNYFDTKFSGREDISLFRVNSEADGIQAVRQGLADVHVTDEVAFSKSARERLGIKLAFLGEDSFDVAFAVRKGNRELLDQMNRFIEASMADGSLEDRYR